MTSLGFGFRVGHWTDADARTGCTVVLPPPGNVASCEVRGSSPGSRETELLHPDRRLTEVHAIVLTGGSAFGLAATDGVVAWLEERGVGYETSAGIVPIVPAAVVYDLATGRADVRPGPDEGRAACDAAASDGVATGLVGAGTGTTVGKWAGREHAAPGGLGIARAGDGEAAVSALAVVNSVGDIVAHDGAVLAGARVPPGARPEAAVEPPAPFNTVLALVATAAAVGKRDARWLAARGADGVTVSVRPAHTRYDGDVCFAVAAPPADGAAPHDLDVLGRHATQAVASAVRAAVAR